MMKKYKKLSKKEQEIYRSLIIVYRHEFDILKNKKAFQKDINILVEEGYLIEGKIEIGNLSELIRRYSGDNKKREKEKLSETKDHIRWTPKGNYILEKYGIQ